MGAPIRIKGQVIGLLTLDRAIPNFFTPAQIPAGWGGACVPVRTAEEIIGALFVSVPLPRELKPGEVRLLTTLAEMVGGAIQRTRLAEETERRMQQLLALRQRVGVASALCYNHAETSTAALAVGSVMRAKTTRTKSSIAVSAICQL